MPRVFSIGNPRFQYAMRLVSNITNAANAVFTTTLNHGYISGLQVRIRVPRQWGMTQINGKSATITVINPTTFSVDIDTTAYDTFVAPVTFPWYIKDAPYIVPITGVEDNILGNNNSIT